MAAELESDLCSTVDWSKKWLVNFKSGKTQLASFDRSNNTGAMDVTDETGLEEKESFNMLRLYFSSKMD